MNNAIISKAVNALLLSAGIFACGAASADVLIFDDNGNAIFGALHDDPGSYVDEYLFTVDGEDPRWATGTAISSRTNNGVSHPATFTFTGFSFFRTNADSSRTFLSGSADTGSSSLFYPAASLAPGNYGFLVMGATAISGSGGAYAGTLNVIPVPEPATYGMLLAGMAVLAFAGRRKKS